MEKLARPLYIYTYPYTRKPLKGFLTLICQGERSYKPARSKKLPTAGLLTLKPIILPSKIIKRLKE